MQAFNRKHMGDDIWMEMAIVSPVEAFLRVMREAELMHPAKGWLSTRSSEFLNFC